MGCPGSPGRPRARSGSVARGGPLSRLYRGPLARRAEIEVEEGRIEAQVSWVNSDLVEREVEIKAVTLHELVLREVSNEEMVPGIEPDIPTFNGPGWMAQVVFDI